MNKAFVREPELDGRGYCPRCGALGIPVGGETLDQHVPKPSRSQMGESAWYCGFARCEVAYFDLLERVVEVDKLAVPVYPKDPAAVICGCFGFTLDDVEADVSDGAPTRIRELLAKSKSSDAQCRVLAVDGRCCIAEVQRQYMKRIAP